MSLPRVDENRLCARIEALAACSEDTPGVTRLAFTGESAAARRLLSEWMADAGMAVREDEAGNLIGRLEGTAPGAPAILVGSHLDTVVEGGKYDGALGIVAGIEAALALRDGGIALAHPFEVIAFCDEEGVRFRSTLLGSKAVAGTLDDKDLAMKDKDGVSVREALGGGDHRLAARRPEEVACYLEVHIEQGPILEERDLACGVVTGIAGQSRYQFTVEGKAGHAGTVPLPMRRDALAGAADIVREVEALALRTPPLVATVGQLTVSPGAGNVIPGKVTGSLDVRDLSEKRKADYLCELFARAEAICARRGLSLVLDKILKIPVIPCSERLVGIMAGVLEDWRGEALRLQSGAGHDGMAMSDLTEIGMIFVRCREGLSHHPDEYCSPGDMAEGSEFLLRVLLAVDAGP